MATRTDRTDPVPFGGRSITAIRPGDSASCTARIGIEDVVRFATLSGDTNPIHLNADAARAFGFGRPVAHGLLTLSLISRLIGTSLPGPGSLWVSQTVRFVRPVLEGDQVTAEVTVTHVSLATSLVSLRTEVRNASAGTVVLSGEARVRLTDPRPQSHGESA